MTRINLVPPKDLHNKHLLAEYRELPRIFALARKWDIKRKSDGDPAPDIPSEYTLGKGHVRFFYDKLLFCFNRQVSLHAECVRRGFNVKHDPRGADSDLLDVPSELMGDYTPTSEALALNIERILDRSPWLKT